MYFSHKGKIEGELEPYMEGKDLGDIA